jgi:hypothetical protein
MQPPVLFESCLALMMSSVVNLLLLALVSTDSEFFDRLVILILSFLVAGTTNVRIDPVTFFITSSFCVSRGYTGVHGELKFGSIFKIHELFLVRANDEISIKMSKNIGHTGL